MDQIEITHTIDGIPADEAMAAEQNRKKRREKQAKGPDAEQKTKKRLEKSSRLKLRADRYLWGIYIMILIFSIVELYSASASEVKSNDIYKPLIEHAIFLFGGLLIVLICQNIHYKYYRKLAWVFAGICLVALLWSNGHGENLNGAVRSFRLLGFSVQPAELAKLAVVVLLARVISTNQEKLGVRNKGIVISLIVVGIFAGLLFRNGLTNTLLLVIISISMFIIGGIQWPKFFIVLALFGVVGGGVYLVKYKNSEKDEGNASELVVQTDPRSVDRTGTQKGRIERYLAGVHPQDTMTNDNRQAMLAKIAQAHGGVIGKGPGNSRESARLPLAFSDYIYSIIIEDTGFLGGIFLMLLYLFLAARAHKIASKCSRAFPALLITGCAVMIVTQALFHMAISVGLAPVSGQPLPFISKGGTSIIVMSIALGMMLSVSKYAVQDGRRKDENKALKEAVYDDKGYDSSNPTQISYNQK